MNKTQLQIIFQQKIHNELKIFRCQMLQQTKEEIMESAYKIICMSDIYEILLDYSNQMSEIELQKHIQVWGLLEYLYGEWLKSPDHPQEHSLWSFIKNAS